MSLSLHSFYDASVMATDQEAHVDSCPNVRQFDSVQVDCSDVLWCLFNRSTIPQAGVWGGSAGAGAGSDVHQARLDAIRARASRAEELAQRRQQHASSNSKSIQTM